MQSIGKNLEFFRKQQGITQAELAKRIGITRQAINSIEHDITVPNLRTAAAIAKVLGISLESIANENNIN